MKRRLPRFERRSLSQVCTKELQDIMAGARCTDGRCSSGQFAANEVHVPRRAFSAELKSVASDAEFGPWSEHSVNSQPR